LKPEDFLGYADYKFPSASSYLGDGSTYTGVAGVLGDVAAKDKDGLVTPGHWIQYQMAEKRKLFVKYKTEKIAYDK
jgi:hypothetical protein